VVPLDRARLATRVQALGRDLRGLLASGGPEARRVLQRAFNGRRVAREPFREPGRKGFRFRATGSYAGALSNDIGGAASASWRERERIALAREGDRQQDKDLACA